MKQLITGRSEMVLTASLLAAPATASKRIFLREDGTYILRRRKFLSSKTTDITVCMRWFTSYWSLETKVLKGDKIYLDYLQAPATRIDVKTGHIDVTSRPNDIVRSSLAGKPTKSGPDRSLRSELRPAMRSAQLPISQQDYPSIAVVMSRPVPIDVAKQHFDILRPPSRWLSQRSQPQLRQAFVAAQRRSSA